MKVGLSLMKNVPAPLAKYVLIPLRLTAAVSVLLKQLKIKQKNKGGLILGTFRASLSENMFAGKGVIKACNGIVGAAQVF